MDKDKDALLVANEQLDKDKKKFAAEKRFKDAGKCQNQLKENKTKIEFIDGQVTKTNENKDEITQDLEEKNKVL